MRRLYVVYLLITQYALYLYQSIYTVKCFKLKQSTRVLMKKGAINTRKVTNGLQIHTLGLTGLLL